MKKKVLISILIIFILLIFCMVGVLIIISPKDDITTLAKENVENQNTISEDNYLENTISNNVESEPIVVVPETEVVEENTKQDEVIAEKPTTSTTTTHKDTTSNNKTDNTQNIKNTNPKSTSSSSNVENKTSTTQSTTSTVEQNIQTQSKEQPTRCTNDSNHGMDIGNSGKWFSSESDAIDEYNEKITYWSKQWETNQIDDKTYYSKCPVGYEIWSCMYCNKYTINFYYR